MIRADNLLSAAARPGRLDGLDALRGVAALAVCLFHWEHIAFQTPNADQVFRFGLLGVELFFLISGFVIAMVSERTRSVRGFLIARLYRLYPAYILSVAMTAVYVLITGKYSLPVVLVNATMLQSFVGVPNIANPYWTLAFEISFYATMSAVLRLRLMHRIEWLMIGWLLIAAAYRFALPGWMSFDAQRPLVQAAYILVAPQFAPFFILGMACFRIHRHQLRGPGLAAMAGALLLTLQGRGDFAQVSGAVYAIFAALCVGTLLIAVRIEVSGLVGRALRWTGVTSYPLYLVHCTVANLCVLAFQGRVPASISVLISVPLAFATAALIHRWVEKPMARTGHRRAAPELRTVSALSSPMA